MKFFFIPIVFAVSFTLIHACTKSEPCEPHNPNYHLSREELALFPYGKIDTLNAIHILKGDTQQIVFVKTNTEKHYHLGASEPVCEEMIPSRYQYIKCSFESPSHWMRLLEIEISAPAPGVCNQGEITLNTQYDSWKRPISTKIPHTLLLQDSIQTTKIFKFYPEIDILGQQYNNVLRIVWDNDLKCTQHTPWVVLFYNAQHGFICIENLANGEAYHFL